MGMVINRRGLLTLAGIAGLGVATYSYNRGIRIPPLVWDPKAPSDHFTLEDIDIEVRELIRTQTAVATDVTISFRAYSPEPMLSLKTGLKSSLRFSVNNIDAGARLLINGSEADASTNPVSETIDGITRTLEISLESAEIIELSWKLPQLNNYSFAAIGDSGGAKELAWCIKRAHALGARFLLHLGDFSYQPDDYANAIQLFNRAPLPCYVSIGNHDFHDNGRLYEYFLNDIGPLNHQFAIGKTRFANIDTAANTLPYAAGHRGRFMRELIATRDRYATTVAFTHRPLYDPGPQKAGDYDIGNRGERDWLVASLKEANAQTLLSGHLHISDQHDIDGINNIIVGQGLGHQDLITNRDYSKMAIGRVGKDGNVKFELAPLAMPMELHCHPRIDIVKKSLSDTPHANVIRDIDLACERTD